MYRISNIVEDAFRQNFRLAEKNRIALDIDFPDPTLRIERPSLLRIPINIHLPLAVSRAKKHVSVKVGRNGVKICDDGIALSPTQIKAIVTSDNVSVKSRVGFGTEVYIKYA